MKESIESRIDVCDDDEELPRSSTDELNGREVHSTLHPSNESQLDWPEYDLTVIHSNVTVSDVVVNRMDLDDDDIETTPPTLSRQERMSTAAAPLAHTSNQHRRMLVDVDEFIDTEGFNEGTKRTYDDDDTIPPLMPSPQRSPSQDAAIKAVLGHDDYEKQNRNDKLHTEKYACGESVTTGYTIDLNEDEIAAIVPPNLQRHSGGGRNNTHLTPGAFSVPGRIGGGGGGIVPRRRSQQPCPADLVECGDGIHMISATLVGSSEFDRNTQDGPMLVYAERLWWKRRLVLCLATWLLLAITAISVSITLAIQYYNDDKTSNTSFQPIEGKNSTNVAPSMPTMSVTTETPSQSPMNMTLSPSNTVTQPPIVETEPYGNMTSMLAASLGVITNCNNVEDMMQSHEIVFRCIGKIASIALERSSNLDCTNSTSDSIGEIRCRLNTSESYFSSSTSTTYQHANGLAMFSCRGTEKADLIADVQILNATVSNCSLSSSMNTAATFVSMGRLCELENEVKLLDVLPNDCTMGDVCKILLPSVPVCDAGLDGFRKLGFFDDFVDELTKIEDEAISICYEATSCSESAPSQGCSLNVPTIKSLNTETCSSPGSSEADIDKMWNISQRSLDPATRTDIIIQNYLS